jgi:2-dehydro-3-deoxygalactonokinase
LHQGLKARHTATASVANSPPFSPALNHTRSGQILQELREASGARSLLEQCREGDSVCREQVFAEFLQDRLQRILPPPAASIPGKPICVMISGMASSSVGWKEVPYAPGPMALDGSTLREEVLALPLSGKRHAEVHLVSGVAFADEMMRGEETELLGLFAAGHHASFRTAARVVLPGTHSKHAQVDDSRVTSLRTFMTGELFDVLSSHSLLRASVTRSSGAEVSGSLEDPVCRQAFLEGVDASVTAGLAASLFQTRCRTVLHRVPPKSNRWFLSGLLIGSELDTLRSDPPGRPILLAATALVSVAYRAALERLGMLPRTTVVEPDDMAMASVRGHRALLDRASTEHPA